MKQAKEGFDPEDLERNAVWDAIEKLARDLKAVQNEWRASRERLEKIVDQLEIRVAR